MKIAMLGHKQMPSREGGVEVVVTELATRMAAKGHDVTVYSRARSGEHPNEFEYEGVRVRTVKTLDIKGFAAATSSYFATKAAILDKPDVIHFHAEGPCAMVGMARRAGVRTVATIHGLDWQRAKWGKLASCYIKRGERIAAKKADEIIVLSEGVRSYFKNEYGRETILIPNGIELARCVEQTTATTGIIPKGHPYVLYLGRIVPEKGVHYLIEAYAKVESDATLVIAGAASDSQSYYERVKRMAEPDKRIVFPGFVQGRILEELYSNAAIYVLPSDLEGMPMSLLEAMSYGLCCITSDIPECADVLADCGITFSRGNVELLAQSLGRALSDEALCRTYGDAARNRVSNYYNWDSVVDETLRVYRGERS